MHVIKKKDCKFLLLERTWNLLNWPMFSKYLLIQHYLKLQAVVLMKFDDPLKLLCLENQFLLPWKEWERPSATWQMYIVQKHEKLNKKTTLHLYHVAVVVSYCCRNSHEQHAIHSNVYLPPKHDRRLTFLNCIESSHKNYAFSFVGYIKGELISVFSDTILNGCWIILEVDWECQMLFRGLSVVSWMEMFTPWS